MIWGRTNVNSSVQPTGQVNTSVGEVEGGDRCKEEEGSKEQPCATSIQCFFSFSLFTPKSDRKRRHRYKLGTDDLESKEVIS